MKMIGNLPITHILLGNSKDASHAVKALRKTGPIQRNFLYRILAVDGKGRCAVADPKDLESPITDAVTGNQWFPFDVFTWAVIDGDGVVMDFNPEHQNDN